jgi:DNA repair photolyase
MNIVYEPKGRAREYAALAANLYKGCTHGCRYCYGAKMPWVNPEKYLTQASPKEDTTAKLKKDMKKLRGDDREILLSFTGDVYQPVEMDLTLTRQALEVLRENNLRFTLLTKGGTRAVRDFDLMEGYDKARFGTTLIFLDQTKVDEWEPGAATVEDRIKAIEEAHGRGIPTWVSLEPVIDPEEAMAVIRALHPIVGSWKVGKVNYTKLPEPVDWIRFREDVKDLLESKGAGYYLKNSLTQL